MLKKIPLKNPSVFDLRISSVSIYLSWMFHFLHYSKIFLGFDSVEKLEPLVRGRLHSQSTKSKSNKNYKMSVTSVLRYILVSANFP